MVVHALLSVKLRYEQLHTVTQTHGACIYRLVEETELLQSKKTCLKCLKDAEYMAEVKVLFMLDCWHRVALSLFFSLIETAVKVLCTWSLMFQQTLFMFWKEKNKSPKLCTTLWINALQSLAQQCLWSVIFKAFHTFSFWFSSLRSGRASQGLSHVKPFQFSVGQNFLFLVLLVLEYYCPGLRSLALWIQFRSQFFSLWCHAALLVLL